MSLLGLPLKQIADVAIREAVRRVQDYLNSNPLVFSDWKFFSITVDAASSGMKYAHGLGYTPKDVIPLSVSGGVTVTWNYASFDGTNINFDTDGACTIRAFIGRYKET